MCFPLCCSSGASSTWRVCFWRVQPNYTRWEACKFDGKCLRCVESRGKWPTIHVFSTTIHVMYSCKHILVEKTILPLPFLFFCKSMVPTSAANLRRNLIETWSRKWTKCWWDEMSMPMPMPIGEWFSSESVPSIVQTSVVVASLLCVWLLSPSCATNAKQKNADYDISHMPSHAQAQALPSPSFSDTTVCLCLFALSRREFRSTQNICVYAAFWFM